MASLWPDLWPTLADSGGLGHSLLAPVGIGNAAEFHVVVWRIWADSGGLGKVGPVAAGSAWRTLADSAAGFS